MISHDNVVPIRGPRRMGRRIRPAGQAWVASGTPGVGYAFDTAGNMVSTDSSGNWIRGTVIGADTGGTVADSVWGMAPSTGSASGGSSGGDSSRLSAANITNIVDTAMTQGASSVMGVISNLGATDRANIASQTAITLANLRDQAAAAARSGDAAAARLAQDGITRLEMFRQQSGLSSQMGTGTMILLGLGILAAAGIAAAVIMKPSPSARRSVRANPSRRSRRRHRKAA